MYELLLKVIGMGIASTMSPLLLAITLALLAGKVHPKQRAIAFLLGAVVTVGIIMAAGVLFGSQTFSFSKSTGVQFAYVDLALGIVFILFAVSPWIFKREEKPKDLDKAKKAAKAQLGKWFVAGFVLNITNFDAVLLFFTETKEIFQTDTLLLYQILLTLLGATFFTLPMLLPIAVSVLMPERADKILKPFGELMRKYGKYIAAAIFLLFGVYFLYHSATALHLQ